MITYVIILTILCNDAKKATAHVVFGSISDILRLFRISNTAPNTVNFHKMCWGVSYVFGNKYCYWLQIRRIKEKHVIVSGSTRFTTGLIDSNILFYLSSVLAFYKITESRFSLCMASNIYLRNTN